MAELRHTFAGGKMNKDLDERIVPKGEYRDALNVEVRTSGDSDVGALQNLYGNEGRVSASTSLYGEVNPTISWNNHPSYHVGSIANEKTNKAYFFIACPFFENTKGGRFNVDNVVSTKIYKDMIIEYDNVDRGVKPLAVDVFRIETKVLDILGGALFEGNGSATVPYNSIDLANISGATSNDRLLFDMNVRPGMNIQFYDANSSPVMSKANPSLVADNGLGSIKILSVTNNGRTINLDRYVLGDLSANGGDLVCILTAPRYLNFSYDGIPGISEKKLITGVNIIDDLLFWTDNKTEPKKINIKRSKKGTTLFDKHSLLCINNPDQQVPTLTSLSNVDLGTPGQVVQDHVTVIRRGPRTSPKLEMYETESESQSQNITCELTQGYWQEDGALTEEYVPITFAPNDEPLPPDSIVKIKINTGLDLVEGDHVLLEYPTVDGESSSSFKQIRAFVSSVPDSDGGSDFLKITIESIDSSITEGDTIPGWTIKRFEEKRDPYFQLQFGRFSFRYKYQDGEYSNFAPWSELAFLPGEFDYIPKKGYNLGMVNNVRRLKVTDFIVDDALRPDDVLEVDILFKDTVSPNVYIVKTIKRAKNHEWQEIGQGSYRGVLDITSDMIHRTLESSQSLRAFDNVPKKALAQEVTGNRIVYGNYFQNYDVNQPVFVKQRFESVDHPASRLSTGGRSNRISKNPLVKNRFYRDVPDGIQEGEMEKPPPAKLSPYKSLKSIRQYRIGVVFGDEYGRETPVIGLGGLSEDKEGNLTIEHPKSVNIEKEYCANINKLVAQLEWGNSQPSDWMEYYRFYVKETSNEYYNLVMDRWYPAEDGNVWLSFQSADRNKLDIETYLILKNEHGNERPVLDKARYKIIAIQNEAPEFIKTTEKTVGVQTIPDVYSLENSLTVNLSEDYDSVFKSYEPKGILKARIRAVYNGAMKFSEYKKVARLNDNSKTINMVDVFVPSADFAGVFGINDLNSLSEYEIEVVDSVVENSPEFEGRFFVKVYRDATLNRTIVDEQRDSFEYEEIKTFPHGYVGKNKNESMSNKFAEYKGNYAGVAEPTTSNAIANYTQNGWSGQGINDPDALAKCEFREQTKRFWRWYGKNASDGSQCSHGDNPTYTYGLPYIDHSYSAGSAAGSSNGQSGPAQGLFRSDNAEEGAPNVGTHHYNAIRWSVLNPAQDGGYSNGAAAEFYETLSTEGTLFKFAGDPFQVIYQVSGSGKITNPHNNHSSCNVVSGGGTTLCTTTSDVCRRSTFSMYFHRKDQEDIGLDPNKWDVRSSLPHDGTKKNFIHIVRPRFDKGGGVKVTSGNAIWETEPKENVDLDLYYEATDAIPIYLKNENIQSFIPIGSQVFVNNSLLGTVKSAVRDVIGIQNDKTGVVGPLDVSVDSRLKFVHPNGTVTESDVISHWYPLTDYLNPDYRPGSSWDCDRDCETGYYRLDYNTWTFPVTLSWFNCYSFGNGLESDRIRDDFNAPTIDNGCKVSTTLDTFGEEHRASGMIWSGIYNSTSGVNSLNEFNMANPITKDLNPSYGSLQALKTRDTNVVAFCEDKVFKILANKDALYNADGSSNVTASNAVLGDAKAFVGDYGISSNPESLAVDSYRMYFTDKQRNKVLRLSQDGLTPISDAGMISYFRDNLKSAKYLIGSYDEIKGEYNLTLEAANQLEVFAGWNGVDGLNKTLSWSEQTKGWVSFKSFIQQLGLSINDEYITGKIVYDNNDKVIWSHHSENITVDANTFYGQFSPSTVEVLFNQSPEVVKGYTSIKYEGSQAKVKGWQSKTLIDVNGNNINSSSDLTYNKDFKDLYDKDGWYVSSFVTDLESAEVPEFKEKEGKWFEYIKGVETNLSNLNTKQFTVQGVSLIDIVSSPLVETFTLTVKENGE